MNSFFGLIQKDWIFMRPYLKKQLLFLGLFYLVLSVFSNSFTTMLPVLLAPAFSATLMLFSGDEACQWNFYTAALGLPSQQLVRARYCFTLMFMLVSALLLGSTALLLQLAAHPDTPFWESLFSCMVSTMAILFTYWLTMMLAFPFFYHLGIERSRPFLLVALLPVLLTITVSRYWSTLSRAPVFLIMLCCILLAALVLSTVISYRCAVRIVQNQQL